MKEKLKKDEIGHDLTLTFDSQVDWLTLALPLDVDGGTGVQSCSLPPDVLQHQGLVLQDDSLGDAVLHGASL